MPTSFPMSIPHAPTGFANQAALDTAFSIPINDLWAKLAPLLADSGFSNMATLTSGWTNDSTPAQARQLGNIVYLVGGVVNATFNSTTFTTVATLPATVAAPPGTRLFPLASLNGALNRDCRLLSDGSVQVITNAASGNAYRFDNVFYFAT